MDPLESMRAQVQEKKAKGQARRAKRWTAPSAESFRHGVVLSFDQTLTNTGISVLRSDYNGLSLLYARCEKVSTDRVSFEGTYDKADKMELRIIANLMMATGFDLTDIVYEMPSVQGQRIESALIGGLLVTRAVKQHARGFRPKAVSNRSMKALLLPPDKRYEKKHVREMIESLIPPENRANHIYNWNEHVHDSVALALTHLYRQEPQP